MVMHINGFHEQLPKSKGEEVILVVICRLTIYGHFIALSHPYAAAASIAKIFSDWVFRLNECHFQLCLIGIRCLAVSSGRNLQVTGH